jgi:hypothetical protein
VFDLVGPARRAAARAGVTAPNESQRLDRGLALLGQTDVLVSGCDLSPQFVSHAGLSSVAAQRETIVKALRTGAAGFGEEGTDPARRLEPFPVALYSLAVSRRAWDRPAGAPAGVPRRDVYVASPNVFCQHSRLRHDAREGVVSRLMLDVVHNDMAVRPGGGGGGAAAFAARVRQGVLDTNAEALVLAKRTPRVNTADLYDAAKGAAGAAQWVVLRNAGDAGWSKLSALPADVKARITQDVAAGYWAVVAPPQRAAGARRAAGDGIGWWRIDPLTGTTVGIGASGHGISFAEYAVAAGAIVMGVIAFGGCGGFDRATGHGRRTLCLVCGVVAGGLALAFLGEFAAAMATTGTLTGGAAATAMGEFVVEGLCAAVDWASS